MGYVAGHRLDTEQLLVDLKWSGKKVHRAVRPGEMTLSARV